jgi:hypothetical protein
MGSSLRPASAAPRCCACVCFAAATLISRQVQGNRLRHASWVAVALGALSTASGHCWTLTQLTASCQLPAASGCRQALPPGQQVASTAKKPSCAQQLQRRRRRLHLKKIHGAAAARDHCCCRRRSCHRCGRRRYRCRCCCLPPAATAAANHGCSGRRIARGAHRACIAPCPSGSRPRADSREDEPGHSPRGWVEASQGGRRAED